MAWQPIATAPKDGTTILLTDGKGVYFGAYNATRLDKWKWLLAEIETYEDEDYGITMGVFDNALEEATPTHWMPLPEAPNKDVCGERSASAERSGYVYTRANYMGGMRVVDC